MGGAGLPVGVGGGAVGVIVLLLYLFLGGGGGGGGGGFEIPSPGAFPSSPPAQGDESVAETATKLDDFVQAVLGDVEATWRDIFDRAGKTYERAPLVLFTSLTQTGCGTGSAQTGPFYCPADGRVYIDLAFFQELRSRFGAPGDFAQAYVIAHEVGHHVQNLLGISEQVRRGAEPQSRRRERALDPAGAPGGLLRRRLGAQRLRGRPARAGRPGRGAQAAAAVGDDRIQRRQPAASTARAGRTARQSSGRSGSAAASTAATRTTATRSKAMSESEGTTVSGCQPLTQPEPLRRADQLVAVCH